MNKTKGEKLCWKEKQDHGECDAVTSVYSIDYKLLATDSSFRALREASGKITKMDDGSAIFGVGRSSEDKQVKYLRTVAALRRCSLEELDRIACECKKSDFEKSVSVILKNLRTKKNTLFFYPYIMSFSEIHTFEAGCKSIEDAFNEDLCLIRLYREREAPGFETFISTVYDYKLLIFQDTGNDWSLQDSVYMMDSKIFTELYYMYGNNSFNPTMNL